jgi:hypothetical protein
VDVDGEPIVVRVVPLSRYVGEAAAARAIAGTVLTGQGRFERLAQAVGALIADDGLGSDVGYLLLAALARLAAAEPPTRFAPDEADDRHASTPQGAANMAYISRLWTAWVEGGVDAITEMVPGDVEWRPRGLDGPVIRGTDELRAYWSSRPTHRHLTMLQLHGDDVLVCATRDGDEQTKAAWSLYRFDGGRLTHALAYPAEAVGVQFVEL